MFGLGLGLTTQDFLRVVKNPKDFLIGFLSQVILLVLLSAGQGQGQARQAPPVLCQEEEGGRVHRLPRRLPRRLADRAADAADVQPELPGRERAGPDSRGERRFPPATLRPARVEPDGLLRVAQRRCEIAELQPHHANVAVQR